MLVGTRLGLLFNGILFLFSCLLLNLLLHLHILDLAALLDLLGHLVDLLLGCLLEWLLYNWLGSFLYGRLLGFLRFGRFRLCLLFGRRRIFGLLNRLFLLGLLFLGLLLRNWSLLLGGRLLLCRLFLSSLGGLFWLDLGLLLIRLLVVF